MKIYAACASIIQTKLCVSLPRIGRVVGYFTIQTDAAVSKVRRLWCPGSRSIIFSFSLVAGRAIARKFDHNFKETKQQLVQP